VKFRLIQKVLNAIVLPAGSELTSWLRDGILYQDDIYRQGYTAAGPVHFRCFVLRVASVT
jgi:hypothetical protein